MLLLKIVIVDRVSLQLGSSYVMPDCNVTWMTEWGYASVNRGRVYGITFYRHNPNKRSIR